MTCRYAHDDAAYVLGALDAAERADYERHLRSCGECSRSVRELAGLPGLLARVPLEVLEPPGELTPVPATLLPAVVAEVRRRRRRRVTRTAALAAAAAVLLVGGTAAVLTVADGDETPPAAAPAGVTTAPARPMESRADGVTGWVSLTEVAWGTRIDLTCTYGAGGGSGGRYDGGYGEDDDHGEYGAGGRTSYALFVRTTDDRVEQVGTWQVAAGEEAHVTMATAATPDEIVEVEVRTGDGESVLRLTQ